MKNITKSKKNTGSRRKSPHLGKKRKRTLYKSKKLSLLETGHIFKIRGPNEKRTTGHGQYKTFATLRVVENRGGGECLFLSILHHLQHTKYNSLDQLKAQTAMDVRMHIVNYVIKNWFDYAHGFFNYAGTLQQKIYDYHCPEFENIQMCQEIYKKYMSRVDTWGTHVELAAAAKLYNFKCVLVTVENEESEDERYENEESASVLVMNDEGLDKREFRPICFILFTGDLMAGHFRFLKPVGNTVPVPIPNGSYDLNTIGNVSTATLVQKKSNTTTHAMYDYENTE